MKKHPIGSLSRQDDQTMCSHCGKAWDVTDPEPPECVDGKQTGEQWLERIRRNLAKGKGEKR